MSDLLPWDKRRETDLFFTGRALIDINLPMKPEKVTVTNKSGQTKKVFSSKYTRESGDFKLKILTDEEYGVPYGRDRVLLYWLITQVVRKKSRIVYYKSVRSLLEEDLGIAYGKNTREWLRGAINRILSSTIYFEFDNGHVHGIEKDTILRRVVGVLDPKRKKTDAYSECYFEFSEDFFRELVTNHKAVPFDIKVIQELGSNFGAMDFYIWWSRKMRGLQGADPYWSISIAALKAQFSDSTKIPLKRFKQQLTVRVKALNKVIKEVYEVNADILVGTDKVSFKVLPELTPSPPKSKKKDSPKVEKQEASEPPQTAEESQNFEEIRKLLKGWGK